MCREKAVSRIVTQEQKAWFKKGGYFNSPVLFPQSYIYQYYNVIVGYGSKINKAELCHFGGVKYV